jgi:hypothetical protein
MNTPCECPLSGYCNRHKINKNDTEHRLCSTNIKYFNMWESKSGKGLVEKAINFSKAVVKHVYNGAKNCTDEESNRRISLCETCDRFNKSDRTCFECGCFLDLKVKWESSQCPLGKW